VIQNVRHRLWISLLIVVAGIAGTPELFALPRNTATVQYYEGPGGSTVQVLQRINDSFDTVTTLGQTATFTGPDMKPEKISSYLKLMLGVTVLKTVADPSGAITGDPATLPRDARMLPLLHNPNSALMYVSILPPQEIAGLIDAGSLKVTLATEEGKTLLMAAAQAHRLATVDLLLNHHASVYAADFEGHTALHWASAASGDAVPVIERLIAAGARVNAQKSNGDGMTPIMVAAQYGQIDAVRALLAAGASISLKDSLGRSVLHWACDGRTGTEANRASLVGLLLSRGVPVDLRDSDGTTPLMLAADNDQVDAIDVLLRAGANVRAEDGNGLLAIHYAALSGGLRTFAPLVHAGAYINSRTSREHDRTPLVLATRADNLAQVKLILSLRGAVNYSDEDRETPLMYAAALPTPAILEALLAAPHVRVNARDSAGNTALSWAAMSRQPDVATAVALLLKAGAETDSKDAEGRTPLLLAAAGSKAAVQALLAAGADVQAIDSDDRSALMIAAEHERADIVPLLLHAGAGVSQADSSGRTALHIAALNASPDGPNAAMASEVVTQLVRAGSEINAGDVHEATPLMLAAKSGNPTVVTALLGFHPDIRAADHSGRDALLYACRVPAAQTIEELIGAGADVNERGPGGTTPLIEASSLFEVPVVRTLLALGAKVNAKDDGGKTALMAASLYLNGVGVFDDGTGSGTSDDQHALVSLLLKAGANPAQRDAQGNSAADYAAMDASQNNQQGGR